MKQTSGRMLWKTCFLLILALLLLLSCSCQSQEETLKLGYLGSLTGDAASIGPPGVAGAQLAIQEINNAGGVLGKKLALIVEDDACSSKSVEAMNKLVHFDHVLAVSGPDCGSAAGPALPIAQEAKVPVVIRWASAPDLTHVGDYIFRIFPSDLFQGTYAAEYAFNQLGKRKVAVLYVKNDYGQGLRDVFTKHFTELGGKIVFDESHNQEDTDVRTSLIKAQEKGPDLVYMPTYRAVGRVALQQMKELGFNVFILAGDAFDTNEIIQVPEAEGVIYPTAITANPDWFRQKVFQATGVEENHITASLAYDSIWVIAEAIKRAGSLDRAKIRDALAKTSYKGVSAPLIELDENRDMKAATYEMRLIQNGKSVVYEN
ncbi:MAG: ABC transporter substrate-binding protein [Nanoarchaeota archaeon]